MIMNKKILIMEQLKKKTDKQLKSIFLLHGIIHYDIKNQPHLIY